MLLLLQVNGDIPPRLKKSAHEIILDFIRSRPPLNPVCNQLLLYLLVKIQFCIILFLWAFENLLYFILGIYI